LFGNPFRPHSARPFPPHVVGGLAKSCYAAFPEVSGEFLILADALDDLGEHVTAAHCRESLHVKGHGLEWIRFKKEQQPSHFSARPCRDTFPELLPPPPLRGGEKTLLLPLSASGRGQ